MLIDYVMTYGVPCEIVVEIYDRFGGKFGQWGPQFMKLFGTDANEMAIDLNALIEQHELPGIDSCTLCGGENGWVAVKFVCGSPKQAEENAKAMRVIADLWVTKYIKRHLELPVLNIMRGTELLQFLRTAQIEALDS